MGAAARGALRGLQLVEGDSHRLLLVFCASALCAVVCLCFCGSSFLEQLWVESLEVDQTIYFSLQCLAASPKGFFLASSCVLGCLWMRKLQSQSVASLVKDGH